MRLYLIRHPRPSVSANLCYGSTDLNVEADVLAEAKAALLPRLPRSAPLFSSPLCRCADFAENLASALDRTSVTYDARLKEMHFGSWEMQSWDAIARAEIDAWSNDMLAYRPGGGENVLEVAKRVSAFRDDLSALQIEQAIVICHAGTIRLLAACEHGLSVPEMALCAAQKPHQIQYGELLIVDC